MSLAFYITDEDFKGGKFPISQNQFSNLEDFIEDDFMSKWLRLILGSTEATAFIADLSMAGDPETAKYIDIDNSFEFDYNSCPYSCVGLREIIKMLIYYKYTSQQASFNQTNGNANVSQEATTVESYKSTIVYNNAVEQMRIMALYLSDNTSTYTDYKDGGVVNLEYGTVL